VALAAVAAARKIPILLVATPSAAASAASPDTEALARRIAEAEATELHAAAGGSVAVRSVAAGVTVRAPRYEILAAGVAERV
jgi:exonuclease VII large subunit